MTRRRSGLLNYSSARRGVARGTVGRFWERVYGSIIESFEMKAVYFKFPGEVEIREVARPEPQRGEALVRVLACGVCGSDVNLYRSGHSDWHRRGHEWAGKVVAVGEGVGQVRVGDVVAGIGSLPCRGCPACEEGRIKFCERPRSSGAGAFAEYVSVAEEFLYPLRGLSVEAGALMEPLTVAIELLEDAAVGEGDKVLVAGAGPIGLMALALCRRRGAEKVIVSHPSTSLARVELAGKWGADMVVHPDSEDVVERLQKLVPEGFDSVLITARPSEVIPFVDRVCAVGARVAFVGMEWKSEVAIRMNVDRFHFRKLWLGGSNHNPCSRHYGCAEELLRLGVINVDELVSHRFPLVDTAEAFSVLSRERGKVRKVIVREE